MQVYRQVMVGETTPDAVTVGIESDDAGGHKAAVWWDAIRDVDADEAEYADVPSAISAAEAARELHGFSEVVVALQDGVSWNGDWGQLAGGREPIGNIAQTDLSSDEAYELAAGIEAERDA